MRTRLRVGLIFGGRSGEHEVSLVSARSVMDALDRSRYEVVPIGISRAGVWLVDGDPLARLEALLEQSPTEAPGPGESPARTALIPGLAGSVFPELDVVFPVLHGPFGEDGTIQGLFEMAGVAYVGAGVLASALCMDKISAKRVLQACGLPVVEFVELNRHRWQGGPEELLEQVERRLGYPCFVKPANLGSSVGISKAHDRDELGAALDLAAGYDRRLLIERAVDAREIEISVLGNDEPQASVPGEIVPCREFYDYEAKYVDDRSELLIPAPLPEALIKELRVLAIQAYRALDVAGMARVDFLLDRQSGRAFLNELNTIPGFTPISMYPKLWEASGLAYSRLLDRLIELAQERFAERQQDRVRR
ncbi:MAG: D-alanine--D-alanine ligase [Chloroflexia bacterium]|nr:D-alanine--D-alanine ligase [Chloroflexia bacterium]